MGIQTAACNSGKNTRLEKRGILSIFPDEKQGAFGKRF